jgi:hypothetical protein
MTDTAWYAYCGRAYAAAHASPPPLNCDRDLLDFSFAVDHLRIEAEHLVRLLQHAEAAECDRAPILRAHLPDLRQIADEAAALLAEAEAA